MKETPIYHSGMRELQDLRDTRRIADRLAEVTLRTQFSDDDRAFIERCRSLRRQSRRGIPGARSCRGHLSQLPAIPAPDAAGGGVRARSAPGTRAASACLEDLRGVPRRPARAGSLAPAMRGILCVSGIRPVNYGEET